MNCIGCGDLVDRDRPQEELCSQCKLAIRRVKEQGLRLPYVISEYFRVMRESNDLLRGGINPYNF